MEFRFQECKSPCKLVLNFSKFFFCFFKRSSLVYLIKTDVDGNEQWSKTFGGSDYDYGTSVQQTTDGGFIIAGYIYSFIAEDSDVYPIKTDVDGNEQWSKTFGGSDYDYGKSVQQTVDGGFIIAGSTESFGAGEGDAYLIKTDIDSNEQWSNTFGGSDDDGGASVQQTADGGFIIAGCTESIGPLCDDVYLVKTDIDGNEQWSNTFGGSNLDQGTSVQQTTDGGFIIAGLTDLGESDAVYLIYYKPPITVTSPNGGEELSAGENFEIIWTSDVDIDFVKIEYSVNSGSGWMEIVASTEKDGSYLWEVL